MQQLSLEKEQKEGTHIHTHLLVLPIS
jgi:hypothetical protein